jgi:hypothetical protein
MAAAVDRLREGGHTVNDEDLSRLSPARFEHINLYGEYRFNDPSGLKAGLRPLRESA